MSTYSSSTRYSMTLLTWYVHLLENYQVFQDSLDLVCPPTRRLQDVLRLSWLSMSTYSRTTRCSKTLFFYLVCPPTRGLPGVLRLSSLGMFTYSRTNTCPKTLLTWYVHLLQDYQVFLDSLDLVCPPTRGLTHVLRLSLLGMSTYSRTTRCSKTSLTWYVHLLEDYHAF